MRSKRGWFPFLAALIVISGHWLEAQVTNATLNGVVRDSTGAQVAGARVRATNVLTNLGREASTDGEGTYVIPALLPGEYRVEAEQSGFKKAVVSGLVLQVAQQARLDIQLEVGQVSERIDVEASTPVVETESPVVGAVIGENKITTLPLNGRNFMELTTLTAGINEGTNTTAKAGILNRGFAPSAAGMPATENNYQLDGADNKEHFFNTFNLAPSVDAVREFRIQIGQYSAEFGAGGGAVINVVTKSGTNQFHGAAWEFVRNNIFDARNFFLLPNQDIAALRRNQFGVAAGGPVIKDRTFVFGNFELTRQRRGSFRSAFVPTDAQRSGNLSSIATALVDPVTRQPFPGNIIPANRINPISANLLKYFPQPNNPGSATQNYYNNLPSQDDLDSYLIRVDHRLSAKHDLMGRYGSQGVDRFTPGTFQAVGGQLQPQRFQGSVLGLTSSFTPSLLNEFKFNYSRTINRRQGQNTGVPLAAQAGMPFAQTEGVNAGFPQAITFQRTLVTSIGEDQPWFLTVNTFQWYDGVTWIKGGHTLKAGADIRRNRSDAASYTHANGNYTFTGQFTGDGFADFLLGNPGSALVQFRPNEPARFRRTQMAYYLADDWKVTSNLTLNLGVRYEYSSVPREMLGLTPIFDTTMGNGTGGLRFPSQNTTAVPFYSTVRPDLPIASLDRETMFLPDKNNVAPRFGFAWRPFGNSDTVVRGGYGIYFSSAQLNNLVQNSIGGPPAQFNPTYTSDPTTPTLTYGGQIGTPIEAAFRTATFGLLTGPEQQWKDAYTQQWSMSLGRALGRNIALDVQYLGSKSTNVETLWDYNYAPAGAGALSTRLPFPKWGRVQGFSNGASANYNALMVNAEKRLSAGLMFKGSYTWAKAMTGRGGRTGAGNVGSMQNPANPLAEVGRTTDDIRQRFVASYSYEIPVGKSRRFLATMPGFVNAVLGGWGLAGVTSYRTGFPLTPTIAATNCNSSNATNPCRPDLLRNPVLEGPGVNTPRWDRTAFDYPLNTAAHPVQTPRFGNAGINFLNSNSLFNSDLSLLKSFPVNERIRFELRVESFNVFNHANFANPTSAPDNPLFGRVFATSTDPRVNQFGLKLYW